MPTTEAPEPDEYEDDELPPNFLIFTSPDLDRDEDKARKAGDKIDKILRRILDEAGDLMYIERALREAESASARARRAREQLLRALSGIDDVVGGVSNAHDVLIFHWNAGTTTSVAH